MRIYTTHKNITFRASRYWFQEQAYLTLMGQLLIDLPTQQSLSDKSFWDHTYPELLKIQADVTFDKGKPKRQAEFLVAGYAYSYDDNTTQSTVHISVGSLSKQLNVYGDRHWLKSGPLYSMSPPQPFSCLALSWSNAFGGTSWPLNPTGKGIELQNQHYPLPNIDIAYEVIHNPHQRVAPVGFLPLWTSKAQQTQLGTFDDHWVKKSWPYLPVDHHFDYWNGAPLDQQQHAFWTGTEAITCTHMHPTKKNQHYQLAGHQLRAFYQKKTQAPAELMLNFDTIWVLPHLEQAVLIWHGTLAIIDETAIDIEAMLIAEENPRTGTFTEAHYFSLLDTKIHRKPPPIIMPEPKATVTPTLDPEIEKKIATQKANMAAIIAKQQAQKAHAHHLFDEAIKKYPPAQQTMIQKALSEPPPLSPIDMSLPLTEKIAALMALIETKLGPEALALFKEARNKPIPAANFQQARHEVQKLMAHTAIKKQSEQLATLLNAIDLIEKRHEQQQQRKLSRDAHERERPKTLEAQITKALKEKHFSNMILCDHYFDNAVFEGVFFENTTFRDCQFHCCQFKQCTSKQLVFDQSLLEHSVFTACQWDHFLWLKMTLKNVTFNNCQFLSLQITQSTLEQTFFEKCTFMLNHHQESSWDSCQFKHCSEENSAYKKNTYRKNTWQHCLLHLIHLSECTLKHSQFINTQWQAVNFNDTQINNLTLEQSQGTHVCFNQCQLEHWFCKNVTMPALQINNSQVSHWQVINSQWLKLSCQHSSLKHIKWRHSDFSNSRYTTLTHAENILLDQVLLTKSTVIQSTLDYLQLSQCDFSHSLWDRCTIINSQWTVNKAIASRFFDCIFEHSFLNKINFYKGSFKRNFFIDTQLSNCNLVRVNFYHACAKGMTMKDNLLPDPLPIGFWEQWREVIHD